MLRGTNRRCRLLRVLGGVTLCLALMAAPALASDLGDARAAGQVGERRDGYVGIVVAAPGAGLVALVEDINRKRRARYVRIAEQNGTPTDQVAALAAKKLIKKAKPGQFVQDRQGRWVRKD